MEQLLLSTKRLQIRNLKTEDVDLFLLYRSNPDITKYQGFDVMNHQESTSFIAEQKDKLFGKPGEWVQYGIEDLSAKSLIGDCAIKLDCNDIRLAEIGITVSHLHQKKGFAKEAMIAILQFLFDIKKVHRVVEIVDAENNASIHLMKSIGFRQEGFFIENIFFKGKWGSEIQFAMLKKEWEVLKDPHHSNLKY